MCRILKSSPYIYGGGICSEVGGVPVVKGGVSESTPYIYLKFYLVRRKGKLDGFDC